MNGKTLYCTIIDIKNLHKNVIFINSKQVEPYDFSYEYNIIKNEKHASYKHDILHQIDELIMYENFQFI